MYRLLLFARKNSTQLQYKMYSLLFYHNASSVKVIQSTRIAMEFSGAILNVILYFHTPVKYIRTLSIVLIFIHIYNVSSSSSSGTLHHKVVYL